MRNLYVKISTNLFTAENVMRWKRPLLFVTMHWFVAVFNAPQNVVKTMFMPCSTILTANRLWSLLSNCPSGKLYHSLHTTTFSNKCMHSHCSINHQIGSCKAIIVRELTTQIVSRRIKNLVFYSYSFYLLSPPRTRYSGGRLTQAACLGLPPCLNLGLFTIVCLARTNER